MRQISVRPRCAAAAVLLLAACTARPGPESPRARGDSAGAVLHLAGARVVRVPPDPNFVEQSRWIREGVRQGQSCGFSLGREAAPYPAVMVVEWDPDRCRDLVAGGYYRVPMADTVGLGAMLRTDTASFVKRPPAKRP